MNADLYNILCENNLAWPRIVVALTSRGIHTVIDFLERGEDALKDMRDKWAVHGESWNSIQERVDGFAESHLIFPVEHSKLAQVLKTLRDNKKCVCVD